MIGPNNLQNAKALPLPDDALNGTAFTFFCYFDSLEF